MTRYPRSQQRLKHSFLFAFFYGSQADQGHASQDKTAFMFSPGVCEGLAVPWASFWESPSAEPASQSSPEELGVGVQGAPIHLIQARHAPSCLGATQLHVSWRDSFFGAQGWGWEGAGSRRWGWCDAAVNQTAFKRAGEEGSTRAGEVLNGYEMCINSPEVIWGYLSRELFTVVPEMNTRALAFRGHHSFCNNQAPFPSLPRDPCVTHVGVCTKEWTHTLSHPNYRRPCP